MFQRVLETDESRGRPRHGVVVTKVKRRSLKRQTSRVPGTYTMNHAFTAFQFVPQALYIVKTVK